MTVRIKDRVKYDITENDLEDIASIPITIENVCIGITIKEINERECKISVRTAITQICCAQRSAAADIPPRPVV